MKAVQITQWCARFIKEQVQSGDICIEALSKSLVLLKKGGLISLCIYSGGDSGFEERDAVLDWLKDLDPHKYLVIRSDYYNRPNHPPIPVLIIRQ